MERSDAKHQSLGLSSLHLLTAFCSTLPGGRNHETACEYHHIRGESCRG